MNSKKTGIIAGLMLTLVLASPTLVLAGPEDDATKGIGAITQQVQVGQPKGFGFSDVGTLVQNVIGGLLIVAAILAFIYLILGGISWITSGGDKQAVEAAREKITNAIIGLIIVAAAYAVMLLISSFLGFSTFGFTLFG